MRQVLQERAPTTIAELMEQAGLYLNQTAVALAPPLASDVRANLTQAPDAEFSRPSLVDRSSFA